MAYDIIPGSDVITRTVEALAKHHIEGIVVDTKEDALAKIKELIPAGASINNGSSRTLEEIGFIEYLKSGSHPWNNLHEAVLKESDPARQAELRKLAVFSDFYLGSTHALAETGELVFGSASGSQLPHIAFTSQNLIFVVGAQKITPSYEEAMKRLKEYVVPLEDARMKSAGAPGTVLSKIFVMAREPIFMGRKVRVIIVKEKLGF